MENIDFDFGKKKEATKHSSDKNDNNIGPLTSTTNLSVSGILHRGEHKSVCVMVSDTDKEAEIRLTAGFQSEVLASKGYSEAELNELIEYLDLHTDEIIATAKQINPMKAFMS